MPRRLLVGLAFALAGLVAIGAGLYVGGFRGTAGGRIGDDAAVLLGVTLPDTAGDAQALTQWKGKVIVVNFWATWCAPCRDEMPEFVRAQQDLGAQGLQMVGIGIDSADKIAQFSREIHLNYPALVGGYGAMELSKSFGNTMMALPFTVVVDRAGRIAHTQLGPLRDAKLRSIVGALL